MIYVLLAALGGRKRKHRGYLPEISAALVHCWLYLGVWHWSSSLDPQPPPLQNLELSVLYWEPGFAVTVEANGGLRVGRVQIRTPLLHGSLEASSSSGLFLASCRAV